MKAHSVYKSYSPDQIESLFQNFLINSWSYSKVSEFSRNEKAFEMHHIYGERTKQSSSTIAGNAYHAALQIYFQSRKDGNPLDIVALEAAAFKYIDEIPPYKWKTQKTTPSIEDCRKKCLTITTSLLNNFFKELGTYVDEIKEIIEVEVYCDEFLTINGVDIPLPCHAKIDVVILTIRDTIAIIDHKSKNAFSDEEELKLSIGCQAITYVNVYESKTGLNVDEVWFVENKYSQNKDKSQQMVPFKVILDEDTRRLYEALLYEPLKRMIEAVNNPDYVYLINNSDNFIDRAEVYEFWCKTMIAEIGDFNVDPMKKSLVEKRLKKIRDASIVTINPRIIKQFRDNAAQFIQYDLSNTNMTEPEKIEHVLRSFGTIVKVAHKFSGYSSNTYLLEVSAGVKIASIHNKRLDIASVLNVSNVRISSDLVVYEGRSYLAVEFAKKRDKDLFFTATDRDGFRIPLGRDNYDNVVFWDMDNHSTPHILICGATGSGKSVAIRSTTEYVVQAGAEKVVILDPKYEFTDLQSGKVQVYNDITAIEEAMKGMVEEMNQLVRSGRKQKTLIVFDEFADAFAQSRSGNDLKIHEEVMVGTFANGNPKFKRQVTEELKSLEDNLRIILQKGRSIGFRVIAATQRASTKIITGDAKVNFPVQICFRVPKEADSRVVLDEPGAESLAGFGDGLIKSPEYKETTRFQAYYIPR